METNQFFGIIQEGIKEPLLPTDFRVVDGSWGTVYSVIYFS